MKKEAMKEVEITQIDRRYERFRVKDKAYERLLLSSIMEQGVRDPLQCMIDTESRMILLDGFKRLRCAIKAGMGMVRVESLGNDEAGAILELIRISNARSLSILEQAALVDELKETHGMRVRDIAGYLERSLSWVSVRLGIIHEMSAVVREEIFAGRFPVRSYMYTLREFTRVNKIPKSEIDTFVQSVSGKGLSTRNIERLAHGFFKGGDALKAQIQHGNLEWTLDKLKSQDFLLEDNTLNEMERRTIKDLELAQKYIRRVQYDLADGRLKGEVFFSTADLLVKGVLDQVKNFKNILEGFHDQRR